jgi:hypothetical protein
MEVSTGVFGTILLDANATAPRLGHVTPGADAQIELTAIAPGVNVNIVGTTDELAKFVADLASVVRELTERELATPNVSASA